MTDAFQTSAGRLMGNTNAIIINGDCNFVLSNVTSSPEKIVCFPALITNVVATVTQIHVPTSVRHSTRTSLRLVSSLSISLELMQTEMHHVRNLKILLYVYMHELRQSHLIEEARLEWLFPGVDNLLSLHQHFLNCLKAHQCQSQEEGSANSYQITQLGDILISQVGQSDFKV